MHINNVYMSITEINIDTTPHIQIERPKFLKMLFIVNALENGWTVKKSQDSYIFTKKHENRREVFQENYLENFVKGNSTDMSILDNF